MKLFPLIALVGAAVCATPAAAAVLSSSTTVGGTTYELWIYGTGDSRTWSSANATADAADLASADYVHLMTVGDAAENAIITSLWSAGGFGSSAFTRAWLGGFNVNGTSDTFDWVDGSSETYTNWNGGEPNNGIAEPFIETFFDGTWNNVANGGDPSFPPRGYFLEIETAAVPEPASLALLALGLFGMGALRRRRL